MTSRTTIEWTDQPGYVGAVWNPVTGCTRVSAGCDQCYAFALHDRRFGAQVDAALDAKVTAPKLADLPAIARARGVKLPFAAPQYDLPFSRVQLLPDRLDVPLRTRKPTCYFVDSMADLFHEDVPDEYLDRVWLAMCNATQHRYLILTKRPERMQRWISERAKDGGSGWPRKHIWLGISVEDQQSADERIPPLLATPAAVRFLSCEPLLGPVDLYESAIAPLQHFHDEPNGETGRIDWVIVGGESGPRARPMDLAWARSLVEQCRAAGVAVFVKQLGSVPMEDEEVWRGRPLTRVLKARNAHRVPEGFVPIALRESHGRDIAEWPEDLRIREWPR